MSVGASHRVQEPGRTYRRKRRPGFSEDAAETHIRGLVAVTLGPVVRRAHTKDQYVFTFGPVVRP